PTQQTVPTSFADGRYKVSKFLGEGGKKKVFLGHYPDEQAASLEHLDFAIAEFQEMKMQPSLERALRHRDILKA
ncbi:MAG: hypothetical protein IIC27_00650, partial [Chloroflexi bacterium]|nr:hypothetical protein [Chloroflexota bacterium]